MCRFRTVLVAADFSEGSRDAFSTACSLVHEDEPRLIVLHVMGPGPLADERHVAALEGLRAAYVPDRPLAVEYLLRAGDPAAAVLAAAAERECDLIVMGTHGRTGLGRLLTGSVAEAVLRHAHCPVLVVRTTEHPCTTPGTRSHAEEPRSTAAKGRSMQPIATIVHPTDFSECSGVALRVARALAGEHAAHLILLHVVTLIAVPHLDEPATVEDPETCRQNLEALCGCLDAADLKYPVSARLKLGESAAEILRTADETGCDLLVMGTHGRTGLGRLLMGSVAEEVLRHARCPVLMIKPGVPVAARAGFAVAQEPVVGPTG
jgi:nucleotide-binding universal stress UspA family protein